MEKRYKVVIAQIGKMDVKNKKRYILEKFKYRDYANNFCKDKKGGRGVGYITNRLWNDRF